ncbi:MAG: hypothetical protein PF487_01505 [Bacteroidales bacterium]|jgi:hypothetical protein|nr:hypothetical protein [Bacteroidales bacterium]
MNTWKTNRKTILIKCDNCGNKFEKTLTEYNRSEKLKRKHYCSLPCNNEGKKRKPKYCLCCNEQYFSSEKNTKFCSQSCSATYNNKKRVGKKRNFTKEGIENIRKATYKRLELNENLIFYNENPNHCKQCNSTLSFKK